MTIDRVPKRYYSATHMPVSGQKRAIAYTLYVPVSVQLQNTARRSEGSFLFDTNTIRYDSRV